MVLGSLAQQLPPKPVPEDAPQPAARPKANAAKKGPAP
jgi:hypothetical protein